MNRSTPATNAQHLFRIDKFKVPPAAGDEFLKRVHETQSFLSTLPGYVKDAIFEQASGPGAFNFITMVEWESADAVEAAKNAVAAKFEANGITPQEFRARLGIEADVAIYSQQSRAL